MSNEIKIRLKKGFHDILVLFISGPIDLQDTVFMMNLQLAGLKSPKINFVLCSVVYFEEVSLL